MRVWCGFIGLMLHHVLATVGSTSWFDNAPRAIPPGGVFRSWARLRMSPTSVQQKPPGHAGKFRLQVYRKNGKQQHEIQNNKKQLHNNS